MGHVKITFALPEKVGNITCDASDELAVSLLERGYVVVRTWFTNVTLDCRIAGRAF